MTPTGASSLNQKGVNAMRVAVLGGGGAMGGLLGGRLARAGHEVTLIDVSDEVVEAIRAGGLTLEDKTGDTRTVAVAATTDPSEVGQVELVINFVKCYHTEAAISAATPLLGPDTTVLTLQNGWGNVPKISGIVGEDRVLVGLTYDSATLKAPAHVFQAGQGKTLLGELDGRVSERVARIADVFRGAGLEVTPTREIVREIWSKLALNVCTLPTSALLRFYAGQLVEHEGTLALMRALLEEVVAVARAQDISLDLEERWDAITGLLAKAQGAKASMLQDVEKGRRTEIDVINGAIVDAGRCHGVPTPYNDSMVWLVRSLEASFAQPKEG